MANKKLDVHLVPHTHWDREWYFTSDDSRTMLYYDMKFLIAYLEKNNDATFTFDGQSSVIDDFLKFSPDWTDRFKKVVKAKKLLVGPYYTQTDNVLPAGESIMRNLEIGNKLAKDMGHSMAVGYLPDTFGHNNQTPQILLMNGIDNLSFYRGVDPEKIKDKLYFNYVGPDGSKILGHWQTHYTSRGDVFKYESESFEKAIVDDYDKPGDFSPAVKSYEKRNYGMPIALPIGTDQKPFNKEIVDLTKELNDKYDEYNFLVSDYETALNDVKKQIEADKIQLENVYGELRTAKTGRVHRSILSSRADVKQSIFKLEDKLINEIEPLAIMCDQNNIDVPWYMVEQAWKDLFKSSAHDSYGASNEDVVNEKIIQRNKEALRVLNGVSAMLTKIYTGKFVEKGVDKYNKLFVFNPNIKPFTGDYKIEFTVDRDKDKTEFEILDGDKKLPFTVVNKNDMGTHERDAFTVILKVENIEALGMKEYKINYLDTPWNIGTNNEIENSDLKLIIENNQVNLFDKATNTTRTDFFVVAADPSVGDTYDHSPITFNDKKYVLNNYQIIGSTQSGDIHSMEVKASATIPSGIEGWTNNNPTVEQDVIITFILDKKNVRVHIKASNKSDNARLIVLVKTDNNETQWKHDQQYGVYKRNLVNEYMGNWEERDSLGYKWDEYPTNLSAQQSWISTLDDKVNVFTHGTKEHEMIEWENGTAFAVTLYRAFGKFGTSKVPYRPGRASGAGCDAPDCQLTNGDVFDFDFIINFNEMNEAAKFDFARNLHSRAHYIPVAWALDRTILRWDTTLDYYDNSTDSDRSITIPGQNIVDDGLVQTALYRTQDGQTVLRLLNVSGKEKELDLTGMKWGFELDKFVNGSKITIPAWRLINILVK